MSFKCHHRKDYFTFQSRFFFITLLYNTYAIIYCQLFIQTILMSIIEYNWHKKFNLATKFWNSIFMYIYFCFFVCFCFCWIISYWNSFPVAFLAIRIKDYLHVKYIQLFDYLRMDNITYITYLNIQKMKMWSLNSLVDMTSVW